jgi:sec-independent protein translocase protein TatB
MLDLSVEKLFILAVVALFVLGPERLPTAAVWLARTLRQIKDYTSDANQKIRGSSARNSTRSAPHWTSFGAS